MIVAKYCKKCGKYGQQYQKADNAWCLDCRDKYAAVNCKWCGKTGEKSWMNSEGFCSLACAAARSQYLKQKPEKTWDVLQKQFVQEQVMSTENLVKKTGVDKAPMKKGEVRRLPKAQSALWTEQWAVMGSGKFPYIVSHKKNAAGVDIEWQCSCPAWTTTTPREDCKHILKVKLVENIPLVTKSNGSVLQLTQLAPSGTVTVKPTAAPAPKAGRKFR